MLEMSHGLGWLCSVHNHHSSLFHLVPLSVRLSVDAVDIFASVD